MHSALSRAAMSYDQRYRYPGVFHVDGAQDPGCPPVPPRTGPHWSSPAAQERVSYGRKNKRCMGSGGQTVLLLLFMLVFATLGFGAYQIYNLQQDLRSMHKTDRIPSSDTSILTPEKQVGLPKPVFNKVMDDTAVRPAAHVIGRVHYSWSPNPLLWEPQTGRAFTEGGVVYRSGALVVNHTGLYHVYSRVELVRRCDPVQSFVHSVFVRRGVRDILLMEGHRKDACGAQTRDHAFTTDSALAAALHLRKDDRVLVNVTRPAELSHNHHANFFGLYKI